MFPSDWLVDNIFPFGEQHTWSGNYVALGDWSGWTVRLVSGSDIRAYTATDTAYLEIVTLSAPGDEAVLTQHGTRLSIDDWTNNDVGPRAPFTVQLCRPPEPS